MDMPVLVLIAVVALIGAFVLGLMTGNRRWAFLPALLPLVLLVWTGVFVVTGNRGECYHGCNADWGVFFTIASVVPAVILAAAVLLGVAVSRRDRSPRRVDSFG